MEHKIVWKYKSILYIVCVHSIIYIACNIYGIEIENSISNKCKKMGQKRKNRKEDFEYDPAPKHLHIAHIKNQEKRLIVILEKAQLESVKVRLCFVQLLK